MTNEPRRRPSVVMYTQSWCPYCVMAKRLLGLKGVDVEEINVEQDVGKRAEMLERSGGLRTVPQIFVGDAHVGGYTELAELERQGGLDPLLAGST